MITVKKILFALTITCIAISAVFYQNISSVKAAGTGPDVPLASWLTWHDIGVTNRDLNLNFQGDKLSIAGQTYQAVEHFNNGVPQDVFNYYSNIELYKAGWISDDSFDDAAGSHMVFYHESGFYLAIDYSKCSDIPAATCVTVWKSAQKETGVFTAGKFQPPSDVSASTIFGKKAPANSSTGINPLSASISWYSYTGTPAVQKYSYCVKEGSACDNNDPNWTSTALTTNKTITNLEQGKTYYWQVRAIYNMYSVPKLFVLADGGTWWKFTTSTAVFISGNAGASGVTMSWTDSTAKTLVSKSDGSYYFPVTKNWNGTVTPSKTGYTFSPSSRDYTDLAVSKIGENYTATPGKTISGSVGTSGVTITYNDGGPKTVTSSTSGAYAITVPAAWPGSVVTPSKDGYTFSPPYVDYTGVGLDTNKVVNFSPTLIHYTISGNAGVVGVKMSYSDGGSKSVLTNVSGDYSISVPYNWSGKITPSKSGISFFDPAYTSYTHVLANITSEDYVGVYTFTGYSIAGDDGYIIETADDDGEGGSINSTGSKMIVGDDVLNREFRSIVSFDTSGIPDTATITSAKVYIKKLSVTGVNPVLSGTQGDLEMSIQNPYFSTISGLEASDYQVSSLGTVGKFIVTTSSIYTCDINGSYYSDLNLLGLTQFRLAFSTGDSSDSHADNVQFGSGNNKTKSNRPKLIVLYTMP